METIVSYAVGSFLVFLGLCVVWRSVTTGLFGRSLEEQRHRDFNRALYIDGQRTKERLKAARLV